MDVCNSKAPDKDGKERNFEMKGSTKRYRCEKE